MVDTTQVVVTVTGISGFVGSTVAAELLKTHPDWKVRGTVRSLTNQDKVKPLQNLLGADFDKVELVEADLLDLNSMKQAIAGSTYVIHVASPFVIEEPRDPQVLIRPAVEGTTNVLTACKENGVKRVSITSSVVAIMGVDWDQAPDVFTDDHWSIPEQQPAAYGKSKTLAERAAWAFVDAMPKDERIELTTVNPSLIIGPTTVGQGFASGKIMELFMNGNVPGGRLPQIMAGLVDVREVATAHVRCLERDEAQGKRFILCSGSLWFREIGETLSEKYTPMGYPIPTQEAAFCLIKFVSFFDSAVAGIVKDWGHELKFDNTRSQEVLGIQYRPMKDSLYDMADCLIEAGHFNAPRQ